MVAISLALLSSTMLAAVSMATPVEQSRTYPLRTVHQFPNNTWIENMAIRSNGQILGTNLDGGNVFLVDPFKPANYTPPVIAFFGNTTAMTGIAEVEDDVFYVQGVRNSTVATFSFPANSSTVWKIDMRPYASTGHAHVSKVADIPKVLLPNGMTLLSKSAGTVLIADSALGLVWRFCVHSGKYEVVIDDKVLKPVQGMFPSFGVNGLKVIGSTLYFSNNNQGLLGTFSITPEGRALRQPRLISSNVPNSDDFDVGPDGSVWLTENTINLVVRVFPDGTIVRVAGGVGATDINEPVSARFGRTKKDRNILYVSTDGLGNGEGGRPTTSNGKIVAIDTSQ